MKDLHLRSSLNTAFVWAIFCVGAAQLSVVLARNGVVGVTMLCSAGLFAFFLFKFQHPTDRSRKNYVATYLMSAGILFVVEILYMYLAFLNAGISIVIFSSVHVVVFLIPMLIVVPFIKTSTHVPR